MKLVKSNKIGISNRFSSVRRQAGMSMVELSVVLVIVALISAAVFFGLQANTRRIEVADNISQITEISAELKKKFGRSNKYAAVADVSMAVKARIIPEQLVDMAGGTATNGYGGQITMKPGTCNLLNDCVEVTWPNVPEEQCMELALGINSGVRTLTIGGAKGKEVDKQMLITDISTACVGTTIFIFQIGR